ncbi:hypothetical protein SAMN05216226_104244 [Halovenus aranensis]|uniref:Uncharacterized protein n=1 Tax=Halovenus aranensis TaxID=890420 RepID=A0A1G8UGN0_9EURY|nr:hypothetical protein [Halovenus aranensis]SDJ52784.1 hypothetical protein SAMN05216226_104244 [Halovenus aranensis]
MTVSQSSDPPQTQEVDLSKELSVYAAIAGLTLSHESIPLLGSENPLDEGMILLSVGLTIAVVFVYVDDRYDTAGFGLAAARTLSTILLIYLMSNGVRGISRAGNLDLSGNIQSLVTFLFLVILFARLLVQRGLSGNMRDYEVGRHYEEQSDWTLFEKLRAINQKAIFASLPLLIVALANSLQYLFPVVLGYFSAWLMSLVLGGLFYRSASLEDVDAGTGYIVFVCPSSILIFLVLFAGIDFAW